MRNGQYILPGELVALLGFVLLPAAVLVLIAQVYYLHKAHTLRTAPLKAAAALLGTLVFGLTIGLVAVFLAPSGLGRILGLREVTLYGQAWPVWPFGLVALAASAVFTSAWLRHSNKGAA
jgi:chromate transport protein ChrA